MTLDLAHLEDFQALAAGGNFSRAASMRNVTQPAFSRRIRALEDWVGATLFEREAQPITLTPAGRAMQPMIASALRCLEQGGDDARRAASRGRATLHFAATHVLSFTFFPIWLRCLETGQPLEAIQLVSDSLSACEQLMLNGQAQFLLCHHHNLAPVRLDPARFTSACIGADVLLLVSAPNADGTPKYVVPTAGAEAVPYLAYSEGSGLGRIIVAAGPGDHLGAHLDTIFTSHLAAALRTMAITGSGIAWLPHSLISEDLKSGVLVRAGSPSLDIAMEIRLIRAASDLGPSAEALWASIHSPPVHATGA